MTKIKAGIYGAAGYTAGELLRLLVHHPEVEITCAQSESQFGKPVSQLHKDLIGDLNLAFVRALDLSSIDILFLCKGHGESRVYLESIDIPDALKVIDLSNDFRLKETADGFVYGLPELNKELIEQTNKLANPGCFATCIQLGLLPAAQLGMIQSEIHTTGITGSTGAGQSLSPTSHFSWRQSNMSVYKAFNHQHLDEIGESLQQVSSVEQHINFIPFRGNFTRGIIATSYFNSDQSEEAVVKAYQEYYQDHPFVNVVEFNPDLKMVVNTNKAVVYVSKHGEKVMIISLIDNLLKGASGQAVQNMNLMFGLPEKQGLNLKSTAF
ncbi:MAG: N-acetyl-gamma-glutamyl-phosphate reductase [Cyclobacteriaceae bacterium]